MIKWFKMVRSTGLQIVSVRGHRVNIVSFVDHINFCVVKMFVLFCFLFVNLSKFKKAILSSCTIQNRPSP